MGVRGLMSYVEHKKHAYYTQERLHDCDIVIDGFGLIYSLYFDEGRDGWLNGEFLALYEAIGNFFSILAECDIYPYVIFDGPIEQKKLPCVLNRLNERVRDVEKLLYGRSSFGRLLPIFAVDALHHYLIQHEIPMAVSLVDADDEIVAVANHLKCPVLSQDSDYYIYNVIGGYLPFTHFQWKRVCMDRRVRRKAILCNIYHISSMQNEFGIQPHLLPFLSVLLGNDWIEPAVFRDLVSSFPVVRSNRHQKVKKNKEGDQRIETILHWLASKSGNDNSVFDKLFNHLRRNRQGHLMRAVEDCVAMYREPTDISETLIVLGIWRRRGNDFHVNPHQVIKRIVRNCRAHPFALNALESNYVCLPVIISDSHKPSPYDSAVEIRQLTYRVLFRQYRLPLAGPELLRVDEYDKVRLTYAKSKSITVFTSQCVMCEQCHGIEKRCVQSNSKHAYNFTTLDLLKKIHPKLTSFCDFATQKFAFHVPHRFKSYLDLIMMSTMMWAQKTASDPPTKCALMAIMAWSYCHNFPTGTTRGHQRQPSTDTMYETKSKQFQNCIHSGVVESASGSREEIEDDCDVEFLHSVAQWLCVLNAVVILHQVVENPSTKFSLHQFLTSSSYLHEIHFRMTLLQRSCSGRSLEALSKAVADRLGAMPDIKKTFKVFTSFLMS